jgi:hypothetical protein
MTNKIKKITYQQGIKVLRDNQKLTMYCQVIDTKLDTDSITKRIKAALATDKIKVIILLEKKNDNI